MFKKLNVLVLVLLLIGQTIISPIAATAETLPSSDAPQNVLEDVDLATEAVELAEESRKKADIESAQTVVEELAVSQEKAELQLRLADLLEYITAEENASKLQAATEAVEQAETSKEEADIESAQTLVNALEDGKEKESLQEKLTRLETTSSEESEEKADEEEKIDPNVAALQIATEAVEKAEASQAEKDIIKAQTLVDALVKSKERSALQDRLQAIEVKEEKKEEQKKQKDTEALRAATKAVEVAEKNLTEENYNQAVELVEELDDSVEKEVLKKRIAKLKLPVKALTEESEEKYGLTFKIGKVTNLNYVEYSESNPLGPEDEFRLQMDWKLDDPHNYKGGDQVTFDLPEGIYIGTEMTGVLEDALGNPVADYVITPDKKVQLIFKDYVTNNSDISGWLEIVAKLDLDEVEVEDGEVILRDPIDSGELRIPIDESGREKSIDKSGHPNKGFNADEIDWEIVVNKEGLKLEGATITDTLPAGIEYKEGTLAVFKVKTSYNGKVIKGSEVEVEKTSDFPNGELVLGDIEEAYLIKYTTTVTDDDAFEFKNNATFKDDVMDDVPARATVTIGRNDPIKKSAVKDYNPKTGIIEWEIEFNYNEKSLDGEKLLDKWTPAGKVEFVEGSLVFEEMEIGEDGTAIGTGRKGLPAGAELDISQADQFTVDNITTDKAYKIIYQTKVTDRVLDGFTLNNTAGFGTHTTPGTGGEIGQYYGSKSAGSVNYADKTMEWTIGLNHDERPMHDIIVTDRLGTGLTLKEGSIKVTVGGAEYTDYTLTPAEGNPTEFEITFPEGSSIEKQIIITYETHYDPNLITNGKPKNWMDVSWKPSENGETIKKENIQAEGELNKATSDVNWKEGSYNPDKKEITWSIYANYLENEIDNLKIVDTPKGNQTIVGDVEVYKLEILTNGEYSETAFTDFGKDITDNVLTVEVNEKPTSSAYKIVYTTKVPGEVQGQYVNEAEVFDGTKRLAELDAKVGITNYNTYASKSANQDGNQIVWTVDVNLGQQQVKDLALVDSIASTTQEYVKHSIEVYEATVDVNGNATKTGTKLVEGTDYDLTWPTGETDTESFQVAWKGTYAETEKAFVVEYATLFFAGHGTEVGNTYEVTAASGIVEDANQGGKAKHKIIQLSGGGATGRAGKLVVHKVDTTFNADNRNPELEDAPDLAGAKFEVKDASTKKVLKTGTTDANGEIDFGRLLFGDYIIEEVKAPDGYIIETESKVITINDEYTGEETEIFTHLVGNYKPVFMIEITKTDSSDKSFLSGATFEVYDALTGGNKVGAGGVTTDGKLIIKDLPEAEGTYYVEEVQSPANYQPDGTRHPVTIGSEEKSPVKLDVENTLYPGKGKLKKVDEDTGEGLSGATFEVYQDGTLVPDSEFTTVADGTGVTKELPPGTYTVKEKTAPTGFNKSEVEYDLVIPPAATTMEYDITTGGNVEDVKNKVKSLQIILTKRDFISEKGLPDAEFTITKKSGDYDLPSTTVDTTNSSGVLTFNDLKPGVYIISETQTPDGYITMKPIEIEITLADVQNGTPKMELERIENHPLAHVKLQKKDGETNYEKLEGAVFSVVDSTTGTPIPGFEDRETDRDGKISITGLPVGKYKLKEKQAPTGYKIEGNGLTDEFKVEAGVTETKIIDFSDVKNEIIKGSVELTKVDGDTNVKLADVEFTLSAISFENDSPTAWTYPDTTLATDANGYVKFDDLRPGKYKLVETKKRNDDYQDHWREYEFDILLQNDKHEYKLADVKNYELVNIDVEKVWIDNDGFEQPDSVSVQLLQNDIPHGNHITLEASADADKNWKHTFGGLDAVDGNGNKYTYTVQELSIDGYTPVISGDVASGFTITNTAKTTSMELTKKDSISGALLNGAVFELTHLDGTLIDEATTVDGKLSFEGLQPGEYKLTETEAAPGYILNSTPRTVTVGLSDVANNKPVEVEIKNDPYANVQFKKVDAETKVDLAGAKFKVVDPQGHDVVGFTDLEIGDNGILSITGLPALLPTEKYKLVETTAPVGYELNDEGVEFTVAVGQATDVQTIVDYDNDIIKGSVKFVKKDADGNTMEKVKFLLESTHIVNDNADGDFAYSQEHETNDKGEVSVDNLRPGTYTFTETTPDGYQNYVKGELTFTIDPTDKTVDKKDIDLGDITNYELVDIEVTKEWKDDNDATGERPESITVELLQNDISIDSKDIKEDDGWTHTFKGLDAVDSNGDEYTYTVKEVAVDGYTSSIDTTNDGFEITNLRSEKITVEGEKIWVEGVGGDQYRPDSITVNLLADGVEVSGKSVQVEENNGEWKYSFSNLDRFDADGKEIEYTVTEEEVDGYNVEVTGNVTDGFTITNTQEVTTISGTKTWKDKSDTSTRPEKITVQVLIDGTTTVVDEQEITTVKDETYTFDNLPKFDKDGESIKYIINELNVPGYVAKIDGYNITNTRTAKTSISVMKNWLDEDINDRPDSITVRLFQNDDEFKDATIKKEKNWTYTFEDLDQFDTNGKPFTYTIQEVNVDGKYKPLDGPIWMANDNGFKITNVRTGIAKIEGTKTWLDENNPDRPTKIEIKVSRSVANGQKEEVETKTVTTNNTSTWVYSYDYPEFNDKGKKYTYSVEEVVPNGYKLKEQNGFDLTNVRAGTTDIPVTKDWEHKNAKNLPSKIEIDLFRSIKNGEEKQVNDKENPYTLNGTDWKLTIKDLPEFDGNGNEYTYEIKERAVNEYNSSIEGYKITNTRKTYAIGDYVWIDRNKDGIQDDNEEPLEGVTVELYDEDGNKITETTTDKNGRYIFDELVSGDYKVKFTLTEEQAKKYKFTKQNAGNDPAVDSDADETGWTTDISLNEDNEELTKKYTDQTFTASEGIDPTWDAGVIELVTIAGTKAWKDDNNEEAINARPKSITVQLLTDSGEVDTATMTAKDWSYGFTGLDKYDTAGDEIKYTIDEEAVDGYKKSIDGFNLTNTRTGKTAVKVTKSWLDADDTERPEEVMVELYQNSNEKAFKTKPVTKANSWTYTFEDLPKYDTEGKTIEYTVKEINLDEKYKQQSITGGADEGFTITNIRTDETSITINKVWKDDENATKERPDKITVNLHRNDGVTKAHEVTANDDWTLTINELPAFDDGGKPYTYTISEHDVAGYNSKVNDFEITNTRSEKKNIEITKTWLDDKSENRPTEIKVDLFRSIDGGSQETVGGTYTLTAEDDWELTIPDLPSFDENGKAYTYTIEEQAIAGYKSTINGFDIKNLRVGTTEVSGEKKWDEIDEQYRPDEVTIQLLANGEIKGTAEASAETDWKYEFTNLAKYDDQGKQIEYTVKEVDVPQGYKSEVKGFNITNTQETIEVTGTKTWVDHGDAPRPAKVTVQLKKGDKVIDKQEIASNVTTFTFNKLPKYDKAGKEITYTVDEEVVSEYNKSIIGSNITNTRKTYALGDYVWVDRNKDGIQDENEEILAGVKVELYDKDGETVIATTTTDKNGRYIFDNLVSGDYKVKFTLTEEQAKKYKFTEQNAGKDSTIDSDADKDGWTKEIVLNEKNQHLTKNDDYPNQNVEASEGIDPTWDAGVIELVEVSGNKTWLDDNSKNRPTEITVQLLENDKEVKTAKVTGPDWNYAFTGLDKYDTNGKEIKYSIDEEEVKGYKKFIDGHNITNLRVGKTAVDITKVWNDGNEADRPDKITVNLLGGATVSEHVLTAKDNWTLTITDLAKYDTDGKEIVYTISEHDVPGYKLEEITGDAKNGFTVTNTRTDEKSLTITKLWVGDEGTNRPKEIKVELFRSIEDGSKELVDTYKVTADDNWSLTIDKLPAFDANGKAYTYEIMEEQQSEYNTEVNGFDITNIRKTYAIGDYVWMDRNKDGIQDENEEALEGVTVELYDKDGKTVIATTTTDKNGHYIFDELVSGDYKVKFTLTEDQAKKYKFTEQNAGKDSTVDSDADKDGWTKEISLNEDNKQLTKEYEGQEFKASEGIDPTWDAGVIELVDIPVTKRWVDKDQSARPDAITVGLLANEKEVSKHKITAKDGWKLTIAGLEKYDKDGKEISYEISEELVPEYRSGVEGFDITNTRKTYAISEYVWIDRNKDGVQDKNEEPLAGVIVELYDKDGNKIAETTTDKNGMYLFDDLESGNYKVKFTLTKDQAKKYRFTQQNAGKDETNDSDADENGWTKEISLNENNKHLTTDYENQNINASEGIDPTWDAGVVELTEIPVTKSWKADNASTRPNAITVNLLANGKIVSEHNVTEKDDWVLTIDGLDMYDEVGKEIVYTITEHDVPGYESEINGFDITNTFIEVDSKPEQPEKPTPEKPEGQRPEDNKPSDPDKKGEGTLPNTATNTFNYLLLGFVSLLLGTATLFARKRKKN